MERFRRTWEAWEEHVRRGVPVHALLKKCGDQALVQLLAYPEGGDRLTRNVIAIELSNRLLRLQMRVHEHEEEVRGVVREAEHVHEAALASVGEAEEAIRRGHELLAAPDAGAAMRAALERAARSLQQAREAIRKVDDHADRLEAASAARVEDVGTAGGL